MEYRENNWLRTQIFPSKELSIFEVGYEHVKPREPYQYQPLDYYLIHFITEGDGIFIINDEVHQLSAGEGFFIPPHTVNNYFPLESNPWSYYWIGVKGSKAREIFSHARLGKNKFTYKFNDIDLLKSLFQRCYDYFDQKEWLGSIGVFYEIITLINRQTQDELSFSQPEQTYIEDAIKYIKNNYANSSLTIRKIAELEKIDRTYLSRLFQRHLTISPRKFLIQYRLNVAADLLIHSSYSISDIAIKCGFSDYTQFSKTFSKNRHISPSNFRKEFRNGHFEPQSNWIR